MNDTNTNTEIDTVFEGIHIEGQYPKTQETDDESNTKMADDSSTDSNDSEPEKASESEGIDTDFSDVSIEGSTPSSTVDTPKISTDDSGLNNDASETWGENKNDIRIDSDELTETTESTNDCDTSKINNAKINTNSDSQSSPENTTRNTGEKSDTGTDTDFSGVDIEGAIDDTENKTGSTNHVGDSAHANEDSSDLSESSQSSTQLDSQLENDVEKSITKKQLSAVSSNGVRSPLEILTNPFRGIINTGGFIATTLKDLIILFFIFDSYMAKVGVYLSILTYGLLSSFIVVFPPFVGRQFIANGLVEPDPSRIELFVMISIFFIPATLLLYVISRIGDYLRGDDNKSSEKSTTTFSRW